MPRSAYLWRGQCVAFSRPHASWVSNPANHNWQLPPGVWGLRQPDGFFFSLCQAGQAFKPAPHRTRLCIRVFVTFDSPCPNRSRPGYRRPDRLRGNGSSPVFRGLLANKPSNECNGAPAKGNRPRDGDNACQNKKSHRN